jgi:outer membrane lipoprotein-sorting protein
MIRAVVLLLLACTTTAAEPSGEPSAAEPAVREAAVERPALPELTAEDLVRRAEDTLRGSTAEMRATMVVTTPRWTREVQFRSWDDRAGDRSFIRILSPKKDKGTGFLRQGVHLWTYLPRVERVMRIPPSMMLQPWMGSDFTNDDLVRESSMVDDYVPRVLGSRKLDGAELVGLELMPKEEAPVVWGRLELWLERERLAPREFIYFEESEDESFTRVRTLYFDDVREVQGRPLPHFWEVVPEDKEGHRTSMRVDEITFDEPMPDELFGQEHLRRAEAVR